VCKFTVVCGEKKSESNGFNHFSWLVLQCRCYLANNTGIPEQVKFKVKLRWQ
jgi:hypothetical protein